MNLNRERRYGNVAIVGDDKRKEAVCFYNGDRFPVTYEAIHSFAVVSLGHSTVPMLNEHDVEKHLPAEPIRQFSSELLREILMSRMHRQRTEEDILENIRMHERGNVTIDVVPVRIISPKEKTPPTQKRSFLSRILPGKKQPLERIEPKIEMDAVVVSVVQEKTGTQTIESILAPVITLTREEERRGYETGANPEKKAAKRWGMA